jgi:hypothetical protein
MSNLGIVRARVCKKCEHTTDYGICVVDECECVCSEYTA